MRRARVLIGDDHQTVLAGLQRLLELDFDVIGAVATGTALVESAARLQPDVVVADISMPLMDGLEATRLIRRSHSEVRVVLLTMHADEDLVHEARAAGASAYVLKRDPPDVLIRAIRRVLQGGEFVSRIAGLPPKSPEFMRAAGPSSLRLTPRQREVLQLLARGGTVKMIAEKLGISPKTVEFHKTAMKQQLGLDTTAELIAMAVRHGLANC